MNPAWSRVGTGFKDIAGALASVVFAAPCRLCGQMLENASRIPICRPCLISLVPYAGSLCDRCGRPLRSANTAGSDAPLLCHVCRRGLYDFDFARSFGLYTRTMARTIILLKHHRVFPLGDWFASHLHRITFEYPELLAADIVVPVPVHAVRLRERGYNQAELIGRPLARRLNLPFQSCLLVRTRPRPDKLKLTLRERWRTVRGAYGIQKTTRVDKLRVLLVDDVMTTGATLNACSRALRGAGAASVACLTAARAIPEALVAEPEPSLEVPER